MKIKYSEQYGSFNFANPSKKSTKHYVFLKDDDGKTIEIGGVRAKLEWVTEDEDNRGYYSLSDGIEYLVGQSIEHSNKWISPDYEAQILLFIKLWNENKEEITKNYVGDKVQRLEKEIASLQKEIEYPHDFDPEDVLVENAFAEKIKQLKSWIASGETELEQYKEGSELYEKKKELINDYRNRLAKYKDDIIEALQDKK